jgi:hypothetical protein
MRGPLQTNALVLTLIIAVLTGCATTDSREGILRERARWNVVPLSYSQTEEGHVHLSVRVSGPTRSRLQQLTFRIELKDAADRVVGREWWTLDLTQVALGGPKDVQISLRNISADVESIGIDPVPDPTSEETAYIKELQLDS